MAKKNPETLIKEAQTLGQIAQIRIDIIQPMKAGEEKRKLRQALQAKRQEIQAAMVEAQKKK